LLLLVINFKGLLYRVRQNSNPLVTSASVSAIP